MTRQPERLLATVLFTDIVGSTDRAAELGDAAWRNLLQQHHALVRAELRRFGGREASTAGDGFLAVFERPARAILCACAIRDAVRDLGIEIRSGLHMGEVDASEGTVGGIAVHTGARVAARASPSEVLVSSTVRDAVAGSGFGFDERGAHELKGVPGEWRLFAVTSAPAPEAEPAARGRSGRLFQAPAGGRRLAGGLIGLALLLGLWGLYTAIRGPGGDTQAAGSSSAGAAALAVLPFRVVAPDEDLWREGMVDLLSTNLDGAGGIRTIDPRTVLSRWNEEVRDATDPPAARALRVARASGAGRALMGSMVVLGGEVRLSAGLYDATTGRLESRSEVRGPPDSIPALVDRLSIGLLREGIAAPGAPSRIDLRRVTTASLPALKAYLAGERKFRGARAREAIADFTRAVEEDSTFALALYRLSLATEWTRSPHEPGPNEYAERASRLSGRLTPRDSLLLRGNSELNQARLSSIRTLEDLTRRYPDDSEGWFLLGDAYFHFGGWAFHSPDRFRAALARAIQLDPGFAPAYVHLVEDAFFRRDGPRAEELLERLRRADPESPEAVGLGIAHALVWGDSAAKLRAGGALDSAPADVLLNTKHALDVVPEFWAPGLRVARAIASQERHALIDRINAQSGVIIVLVLRGRLAEAEEAFRPFAEMVDREPSAPGWARYWRKAQTLRAYLWGYPLSPTAEELARSLAADPAPEDHLNLGAYAAKQGRWPDADRHLGALDSLARAAVVQGDSAGALRWQTTAAELRGYAAAGRGDLDAAIRELEAADVMGRDLPGGPSVMARYHLARLLLQQGRPREAERYLANWSPWWWPVSTPVELYLGAAREEQGDIPSARRHYERFVRAWQGSDPELWPMLEEGRAALERLRGMKRL